LKQHECKEAKVDLPPDFLSSEEQLRKEELSNLSLALEEIKDIVHHNSDSLQSVTVDGLMHALTKKLKGESLEQLDFKQLEVCMYVTALSIHHFFVKLYYWIKILKSLINRQKQKKKTRGWKRRDF
jgi:hypothetical protein